MTQTFKVGDILIGKRNNGYVYTSYNVKVEVTSVSGDRINVRCLSGIDQASIFIVDASKFEAATKLRDLKKKFAPRFVKAVIVDAGSYQELKTGAVVILDTHTYEKNYGDHLVSVHGSTWGKNLLERFAIDPTIRVSKKELINA